MLAKSCVEGTSTVESCFLIVAASTESDEVVMLSILPLKSAKAFSMLARGVLASKEAASLACAS